jgi:hypothetical protein
MVFRAASGEISIAPSARPDDADANWSRSCGARLACRTRVGSSTGSAWSRPESGGDADDPEDPPVPPGRGTCVARRRVGSAGASASGQDAACELKPVLAPDHGLASEVGGACAPWLAREADQGPVPRADWPELALAPDHALVSRAAEAG